MTEEKNIKSEPDTGSSPYVLGTEITSETTSEAGFATQNLKKAKDGSTILIPQPSDDPNDPLNWSWSKKHLVFFALLPGCFLTDWTLTYGTSLFVPQAMQWHMSVESVSQSISGGIFMQGPGGLLAVPLCQRYGRLPVLFWSQFLSLIVTIGATLAHNYAGFTACRTLQGFFGAAPQVIGLSIVHDLFFFHERARKVNIWAFSFLIGPYLGPFISAFVAEKLSWRNDFAVLCGFYGFSVLCVAFLGDETLYEREKPTQVSSKGFMHRIQLLLGVEGYRHRHGRPTIWATQKHQYSLLLRPYLLLPCFGFVMIITMWTIGLVSTISEFVLPPRMAGGYGFSNTNLALLYFAPMIGTVLAEAWGHWFNDFLLRTYVRKHNGQHKNENRLWGVYPAWILGVGGLILFGETVQHQLSWVGLAFGWAMNNFSTLATTTAISAYLLDSFPHHAALAAAWLCAFRTLGGFTVTYFQLKWVAHNGAAVAFGCQAAIIGGAIISIIATQLFGQSWRKKIAAPRAEN